MLGFSAVGEVPVSEKPYEGVLFRVSSKAGTSGSNAGSLNLTLPAGIRKDWTILVVGSKNATGDTWTTPSGYTLWQSITDGALSTQGVVYVKTADGTEGGTTVVIDPSSTNTGIGGMCLVFSGVDPTTPLDIPGAAGAWDVNAVGPDPTTNSVTTVTANAGLVHLWERTGSRAGFTVTYPSLGWVFDELNETGATVEQTIFAGYEIQAAAGASTGRVLDTTGGTNISWDAVIALRPYVPSALGSAESGAGALTLAPAAATVKVAKVVGAGALALAGTGSQVKKTAQVGTGALVTAGTGRQVKKVPQVGTGALTLAPAGVDRKIATPKATSVLVFAPSSLSVKRATPTATGALALIGWRVTAAGNTSAVSGFGALGLVPTSVDKKVATPKATGALSLAGLSADKKIATPKTIGSLVLAPTALDRKKAVSAGIAALLLAPASVDRKKAVSVGTGIVSLAGTGLEGKKAVESGRGVLVLAGQVVRPVVAGSYDGWGIAL